MLNFYDLTGVSPSGREAAWFDVDYVRAWAADAS